MWSSNCRTTDVERLVWNERLQVRGLSINLWLYIWPTLETPDVRTQIKKYEVELQGGAGVELLA